MPPPDRTRSPHIRDASTPSGSEGDPARASAPPPGVAQDTPPGGEHRSPPEGEHRSPPRADRLLVVRLGALGDVVRTLPAVAALRGLYPGAHLAWLVEPASRGVVEASGLVDEALVFPRRELVESIREADGLSLSRCLSRFVRALRDRRFEIALDFHGGLKSGLLTRLSGAPLRYGFGPRVAREGAHLFVNRRAALSDPTVSRFDRNAALVRALAPFAEIPERPLLQPSPLAIARLAARLRVSGRERAEGFVLVHPGSSAGAQHKRYPAAAWAAVARDLAERDVETWLVVGPNRNERQLAEQIIHLSGDVARAAPETRSFDDLLALLVRASAFASSDSGPLHAAMLAGVPAVQLVGPTHPVQNAPFRGTPSRRLHAPLPCSPCRRGCDDPACMRAIPPSAVVREVLRLREALDSASEQSVERTR